MPGFNGLGGYRVSVWPPEAVMRERISKKQLVKMAVREGFEPSIRY
jgi:hypothetical protein